MGTSPAVRTAGALLTAAWLLAAAGCTTLQPPAAPPSSASPPKVTAPPAAPSARPAPAAGPAVQFEPVGWDALPGWYSDPIEQAWPALQQSCRALARRNAAQAWLDICRRAQALDTNRQTSPAVIRAFFEREFVAHRLRSVDTDGTSSDEGLITGYYEPLLRGSRTRDARYRYPLYAAPDDLLVVDMGSLYPALQGQRVRARIDGRRVVPYYPRAQIARGVPSLTGRELVWVDDRLDAFFLEIQGSGRVQLPDGSVMRLGYAEQNGHPYRAIGRVLVERGDLTLEEATMQGIRRWAEANPDRVTELLDANPSQVFFRELPAPAGSAPGSPAASAPGNTAASGPPGSLGVPLTPMRSIAIDPRSVMLGAPVWLATFDPRNGKPLERLTFAQDTGGAIIGAIRADLFWGFGSAAGEAAGRMRERGRLWVLLPKEGR